MESAVVDLIGKTVVITGAGSGIGAAYAREAAGAGAHVVVNDIDAGRAEDCAAAIRDNGGRAIAQAGDVCIAADAEALIERCISEYGSITGLVNNAAVMTTASIEKSTADDFRRMLEVNVIGLFNCCRAALDPMVAQGSGSIINVTSGSHTGQANHSSYGASKGAVASLTYAWADELRGRGVRVNAMSPVGRSGMTLNSYRYPDPEANAPAVLYLLSDASRDVTGQILRIHGEKLSIMAHPANRKPVLQRDGGWTLDTVADAFQTTLGALQLPTNVATYDIVAVEAGFGADNTVKVKPERAQATG